MQFYNELIALIITITMIPEDITERRAFLKETISNNLEYALQEHLKTFLASFSASRDNKKRELLIDAIIKIENAERPNKTFVIDASKFEDDQFRIVNLNGTVGDFHTKSKPVVEAPLADLTSPESSDTLQNPSETLQNTSVSPPEPLRSKLGFRQFRQSGSFRGSGGRRRTNKHSKNHMKSKKYKKHSKKSKKSRRH